MWQSFCQHSVVRFLASLKLAVCVISGFIFFLAWGTITESSYSTVFAKHKVYQSASFVAIQIFLFLNILFAALVRLPYKKRLVGFYTTHAGLLTLFTGAAITSLFGLDGSLRLFPDEPNHAVVINEPTLYAFYQPASFSQPLEVSTPLPKVVIPFQKPDKVFFSVLDYDIYLANYLPFALPRVSHKPNTDANKKSRIIGIKLTNANFSQPVELSTLEKKFAQQKLGPLSLGVYAGLDSSCFKRALVTTKKGFILVGKNGECKVIDQITDEPKSWAGLQLKRIQDNNFTKIELTANNKIYVFYPEMSEYPITNNIAIDYTAPYYLYPFVDLGSESQVVFFADDQVGFGKGTDWQFAHYESGVDVALPWMGFTLSVERVIKNKSPHTDWYYQAPRSGDDERHWAAEVNLVNRYDNDDQSLVWIDDASTKTVTTKSGATLELILGNKIQNLPFDVTLDRFKMDTNPGTNEPASYESFVNVKHDAANEEKAHIYMNNPLKKNKYTLYQASYFQIDDQGSFGSVLSVNYDPGRPVKYAGSFLLVLGATTHFIIKGRKRIKS